MSQHALTTEQGKQKEKYHATKFPNHLISEHRNFSVGNEVFITYREFAHKKKLARRESCSGQRHGESQAAWWPAFAEPPNGEAHWAFHRMTGDGRQTAAQPPPLETATCASLGTSKLTLEPQLGLDAPLDGRSAKLEAVLTLSNQR